MSNQMKTPEEDKFYMNGTSRKINHFNQALAKIIEEKIMIKSDSLKYKEVWENYKDSGFMKARNRFDLCESITGQEMDTRETVQTTIKRVYQELVDNIPGILNYFEFHNMNNDSNLIITTKIYEDDETSDDKFKNGTEDGVQGNVEVSTVEDKDTHNDWSTVEGNFTPQSMSNSNPKAQKEGSQKNNFEKLIMDDDSDDISELYNEDEGKIKTKSEALQENRTNNKTDELIIPLLGVNSLCNEIHDTIQLYLETHIEEPKWITTWNQWMDDDFNNVMTLVQLAECINAPNHIMTMELLFEHMANMIEPINSTYELQTDSGEYYLIEKKENLKDKTKKIKNSKEIIQTDNQLTKEEIQTVEEAMKKGSVNELDFNILCKWIMQKGNEVKSVCNNMEVIAKECNIKMEKSVVQDKDTILNTIETAADKFASQMLDVTRDATDEFKMIQMKMDEVQTKTHSNLKTHQKNIDKVKGEIKKAEYEGVTTVNRTANNQVTILNKLVSESSELIDKLVGTKHITTTKQKEIDNMMVTLQKRIHGATEKFEEVICAQTDNERTSFINWMNKRMKFINNVEGEGDIIHQLMNKHDKLVNALDKLAKERMKLNAERLLLEGDRSAFQHWWDAVKGQFDNAIKGQFDHVTTNNVPTPIDTVTQQQSFQQRSNNDSEAYMQQQSSSSSSVFIDKEPTMFTFKLVDTHNDNPKRSPKHGKVDQGIPQANQQVQRIDHFKIDQFPPDVQPPLIEGTQVEYQQNIYKYNGHISYDNLPMYINDTWYYDIITTRNVKLTNCSSKYMTEIQEVVPGHDEQRTTTHQSTGDYLPFQQPQSDRVTSSSLFAQAPWPIDMAEPKEQPRQREQPYQQGDRRNNDPGKPWMKPKLAANEFIYPLGFLPCKVQHHDITKYGNKWDIQIQNKDEFRTFYENLRNQMRTYNVFLIDYDKIELNHSLTELTPHNCEHYAAAVNEMSRALFNFFSANKDTIFEFYKEPVNALETFRPFSNGFGFLMHMMKRVHPTLKRRMVDNDTGITAMPEFQYYTTIHKFINALVAYRKDEIQVGRRYSDKELLSHICQSLDERFASATYKIRKELKEAFSNPSSPKPIPQHFKIDNELAIRIMELIDEEDRDQDFDNKDPAKRPRINKANYGGYNKDNYSNQGKEKWNDKSKSSSNKYKNKDSQKSDQKWADNLKWEIMEGAECAGCRRSNHDVYKTGCPAFAQFALCQEFYKTVPTEQLEKVKNAFIKHQKTRRNAMSNKKKEYRATIRTLEADPDYDESVIVRLRKTFFDEYKKEFQEERHLDDNPFVQEDELENEGE